MTEATYEILILLVFSMNTKYTTIVARMFRSFIFQDPRHVLLHHVLLVLLVVLGVQEDQVGLEDLGVHIWAVGVEEVLHVLVVANELVLALHGDVQQEQLAFLEGQVGLGDLVVLVYLGVLWARLVLEVQQILEGHLDLVGLEEVEVMDYSLRNVFLRR